MTCDKKPESGPTPGVDVYRQRRDGDKDPSGASRLLFAWLSDDHQRAHLYKDMVSKCVALPFESRALKEDEDGSGSKDEDGTRSFRQTAHLLVARQHLEEAYTNSSQVDLAREEPLQFSNSPFQGLGGTFMLAIDEPKPDANMPFKSHDAQRKYCYDHLKDLANDFPAVATVAFKTGALLPLKSRNFDLALLAEQVSVRYVATLFGFPQSDLGMLLETGRKIGKGLQYQMMARHFVTEPKVILEAKQALAAVSQRVAELIDIYDQPIGKAQLDFRDDLDEELKKLRDYWIAGKEPEKTQALKGFVPLMRQMARDKSHYSTTEKAILVAGLIGGAVTNIRAAICIAVNQFFCLDAAGLETVKKAAVDAFLLYRDANWDDPVSQNFRKFVEEAMRVNPPASFIPRRAGKTFWLKNCDGADTDEIKIGDLIVIGVGGGSWTPADTSTDLTKAKEHCPRFKMDLTLSEPGDNQCPFNKVFGGPPELYGANGRAVYTHSCFGKDFAMHVVTHTARQMMMLPGLTQALDDTTAQPVGLTKKWGYYCESYPLEYQREKLLRQSPLQTVLTIKNPVPENAQALKQVLQFGAPFIEKVLQEARHVHFASFIFLDNDSKLVLFTAFDGDFDAYIGHFAREFGPLFDRFFSHIENGPPAPIAEHAFEFVQFLRRFQTPSVGGYFFSAYPEAQVDQIRWRFNKERKYDLFDLGRGHD